MNKLTIHGSGIFRDNNYDSVKLDEIVSKRQEHLIDPPFERLIIHLGVDALPSILFISGNKHRNSPIVIDRQKYPESRSVIDEVDIDIDRVRIEGKGCLSSCNVFWIGDVDMCQIDSFGIQGITLDLEVGDIPHLSVNGIIDGTK